jgi:hypothetical protein
MLKNGSPIQSWQAIHHQLWCHVDTLKVLLSWISSRIALFLSGGMFWIDE